MVEQTGSAASGPSATRPLVRLAVAAAFVFLALFAVTSFPSAAAEQQARAYGFTEEQIHNGLRYAVQRRLVFWSATAVSFAFWTFVVLAGWGRRLADGCGGPGRLPTVLRWVATVALLPLLLPVWLGALLVGRLGGRAFPGFFRWLQTVVLVGVVCFLAQTLLSLPFGLLGLEVQRAWGMTSRSVGAWLVDFGKGTAIAGAVGAVPLVGLYLLLRVFPRWWWAVAAAGGTVLGMAYAVILPVAIDPLLHHFRPLEHADLRILGGSTVSLGASSLGTGPLAAAAVLTAGGAGDALLEQDVQALAARAGVPVTNVLVMDASRRSRHTNAYFTGFGPTRRIVLYDTLLRKHTPAEIESILGHEIGHWKHNHIVKGILLGGAGACLGFFLLARILLWAVGRRPFLLRGPADPAGLPLILLLAAVGGWLAMPVENAVSRYFERQADESALQLAGHPDVFIAAEKRLARDNIGNLAPNPLSVWLFYTHPPVLQRIRMGEEWKQKSEE